MPFDYDRRHSLSLVGNWRISDKFQLAATFRAFSGFPRTPVLGLRVSADETDDGRFVPALDPEGAGVAVCRGGQRRVRPVAGLRGAGPGGPGQESADRRASVRDRHRSRWRPSRPAP